MPKAIRLKRKYVEAIQQNPGLLGDITQKTGKKSVSTVQRWCQLNTEQLTMFTVLNCIRDFLKLGKDVILTEEVELEEA